MAEIIDLAEVLNKAGTVAEGTFGELGSFFACLMTEDRHIVLGIQ